MASSTAISSFFLFVAFCTCLARWRLYRCAADVALRYPLRLFPPRKRRVV